MTNIKDILAAWGNWSISRIGTDEYKGMSYQQANEGDLRPYLNDIQGMLVDHRLWVA
ncbi:MAG: hypothetical protein G5701_04715 [Serratia symbiotica]|nr:hypothetical protein [Serratia symbiotica]